MKSEILEGEPIELKEPIKDKVYYVLSAPSKVRIVYENGTKSETIHYGVKETVVHVRIEELNRIRLPIDANPRKPEQIPSLVRAIQASAQEGPSSKKEEKQREGEEVGEEDKLQDDIANEDQVAETQKEDEKNIFVFKNNGIDIFCKKVTPEDSEEKENSRSLVVEFGPETSKDGICNGGLTYYALQPLTNLPDDACVKLRFYEFEGAPLELKSRIAEAKNRNRSVSTSDDANFMGYFERIKVQLGPEYTRLVKWQTGDVEVTGDLPVSASTMVRLLTALQLGEAYHWDVRTGKDQLRSHNDRNNLLLIHKSKALDQFVAGMRGD
jgi:hypothetical protein